MINQDVFNTFPVIETERLLLRESRLSDKEGILMLRSDAQVNQFMFHRPPIKTVEDAAKDIEMNQKMFDKKWAIVWTGILKETNELAGTCGFNLIDSENHRAEVGGEMIPKYWRSRLAIETFLATLQFGFEAMNLHSITAKIYPENISTISLLESFGFTKEAHLKDRMFINNEYKDLCLYTIIEGNEKFKQVFQKHQKVYKIHK